MADTDTPLAAASFENSTKLADMFSAQTDIFAERLQRARLIHLELPTYRTLRARVWRNQPFELVEAAARPFLHFAGLELKDTIRSAYDDSFGIGELADYCDIEIVSFDFGRLRRNQPIDQLIRWFLSRLDRVRVDTDAPILVTNWLSDDPASRDFNRLLAEASEKRPGIYICDTAPISKRLAAALYDERSADLKGTNLSDAAILELGRLFGLCWIPAAARPSLKAVVVDLDETLYGGVLAEDGIDGIVVTADHIRLQRRLRHLRDKGMVLGLISRNDPADVQNLFAHRSDLALALDDFSEIAISWRPKSDSLRLISDRFRIGADAILYIDDNVGELAQIAASVHGVHLFLAKEPAETARALVLYPGLHRFSEDTIGRTRSMDLEASQKRAQSVAGLADPAEYLRSLSIELTFDINNTALLARMHDLSRKTNQFNVTLARLSEAAISRGIAEGSHTAVCVSLRDKLSDSGVIGFIYGRHATNSLTVEDLCISCRALGRNLEDAMIAQSLLLLASKGCVDTVHIPYKTGDRNLPALTWLAKFARTALQIEGAVSVAWGAIDLHSHLEAVPATLNVRNADKKYDGPNI